MIRPWPAQTKLLICVWHRFTHWRPPSDMAEHIRRRYPEMKVVHLPTFERFDDELPDADILIGWSLKPEQLRVARKLRWIHATAAGVGQLMYPELRASGIEVTNARGVHAVPMAEHIVGMILALARRFPSAFRHQVQRHWGQQEIWDESTFGGRPRELVGQVLLIVGFGAIGQEVARRARPLGMRIWGVTRTGRGDGSLADRILPAAQLEAALPEGDFVVLTAPETPETQQLIAARQIAAMKRTAFLINVARGSLVDEAALVDALQRRAIAGAALDVAEREPLPPESPLWMLENVFITPHISAVSQHLWEHQTELILDNLERWFSGKELRNRVDLERGY